MEKCKSGKLIEYTNKHFNFVGNMSVNAYDSFQKSNDTY